MPQIIQTIDHIARIKQRSVLFLSFYDGAIKERLKIAPPAEKDAAHQQWVTHRMDYSETLPIRQQIIDWLDAKGIAWQPCFPFAPGWVTTGGYVGDIYLDVPYDKTLPLYQELEEYLQYDDDRMRHEHVWFFYLPLRDAMRNGMMNLAFSTTCNGTKMRNPDRIPQVLHALQKSWEKEPDLRLGQLLVNTALSFNKNQDIFYLEDDVLLRLLQKADSSGVDSKNTQN